MPRPVPHPIRAVLFDLDGTLIDTESLCNAAGVETCRRLGLDADLAFFESLAGIHDAARMVHLSQRVGRPVDQGDFYRVWDAICTERFAAGIPLKSGVDDLLDALQGRLPIALVTSSRRASAQEKLAAAGLDRRFDLVVTVEDVAAAKPAPDPYRLAAERLGLSPGACIAIEDSDPGAASAQGAGCFVLQVPDLPHTSGAHADLIAPTLLDGARAVGLL